LESLALTVAGVLLGLLALAALVSALSPLIRTIAACWSRSPPPRGPSSP
jgi:uncharacterized membrane protein